MILALLAQTNSAGITVPSFTIPLPSNVMAWIAAHGILLWFAARFLVKWLDQYQGKNKWLDLAIWILEHVSLNKNVEPLSQRQNGKTDNGLGTGITPNNVAVSKP